MTLGGHLLTVATYNIHKGFSHFNRRLMVRELRDCLPQLGADIVLLQEVQGAHARHAKRFPDWPAEPQYEFLADSVWRDFAYGRNAVYDHGHHGNAVLSRYRITRVENDNVSAHAFERRGLLHCEIDFPSSGSTLHCVCVHLGLNERARQHQITALIARIEREVPSDAPLIIGGDFNDWRDTVSSRLALALDVHEVFRTRYGKPARSFPSAVPLMRLDRIYVRGFGVQSAQVHRGLPWSRISDHAVLSAQLLLE